MSVLRNSFDTKTKKIVSVTDMNVSNNYKWWQSLLQQVPKIKLVFVHLQMFEYYLDLATDF